MKTVLHCALMLAVVLIGVPGYTAERLALYDDFNATQINPDKWFGSEYSPAFPSASTEAIRQLQDSRLRLGYRSYGPTDADSGRLRSELALLFRTPAAVTAIQAAVQVTDVGATGCPGNPERTVASANLGGRFFGTAPSTPGGDVTDTVALIGMFRGSESTAPPDELRARSLVFHCTNRPCTAGSELHRQDLGPVKRGEFGRLRVQWDRDHHQFIFQRDEAPEVLAPYAVSDTAPPGIAAKLLNAMQFVPNCPATPRPMAFIEAWFDDVMVNESAAPVPSDEPPVPRHFHPTGVKDGLAMMGAAFSKFCRLNRSNPYRRFADIPVRVSPRERRRRIRSAPSMAARPDTGNPSADLFN